MHFGALMFHEASDRHDGICTPNAIEKEPWLFGSEWIGLPPTGDEEGSELMSSVQSLAEAHLAYPQIFDITQAKHQPELLYDYMLDLGADNPAAGDTMATYTFARLFSEGRVGELLDLPSQFDQSLQLWLQNQVLSVCLNRLWVSVLLVYCVTNALEMLLQNSV